MNTLTTIVVVDNIMQQNYCYGMVSNISLGSGDRLLNLVVKISELNSVTPSRKLATFVKNLNRRLPPIIKEKSGLPPLEF